MDCKTYSRLSGPGAGGPVREGAMHRLCSSGLSPSEGVGGAESRAALFAIFSYFVYKIAS